VEEGGVVGGVDVGGFAMAVLRIGGAVSIKLSAACKRLLTREQELTTSNKNTQKDQYQTAFINEYTTPLAVEKTAVG